MENKLKQLLPNTILEWIFFSLITYLWLSLSLVSHFPKFSNPVFIFINTILPTQSPDPGFGVAMLFIATWITLIFVTTIIGLILIKKLHHRVSRPLIFIFLFGIIYIFLFWNISNFVDRHNYQKQVKTNRSVGQQLTLSIDNCSVQHKLHSIKHPSLGKGYYLSCDAQLKNAHTITKEHDWDSLLFEIHFINQDTNHKNSVTTKITTYPIPSSYNFSFDHYLSDGNKKPTSPPHLTIPFFTIHVGTNHYDHLNLDLDLSSYINTAK